MQILSNFGVNWIQLIEATINFLLLLIILRIFVYKPVLRVLDKRRQMVEQTIKDSELIAKQKQDAEEQQRKVLHEAQLESQRIIQQAIEQSEIIAKKLQIEAKDEADRIIQKAREEISLEKNAMFAQIKGDISSLIGTALSKTLKGSLTQEEQEKILHKTIEEIS